MCCPDTTRPEVAVNLLIFKRNGTVSDSFCCLAARTDLVTVHASAAPDTLTMRSLAFLRALDRAVAHDPGSSPGHAFSENRSRPRIKSGAGFFGIIL